MNPKKLFVKIWKDPVWSKVIATGLIILLSLIPIKIFWNSFSTLVFALLMLIIKYWYILVIAIESIIITFLILKNKKTNKEDDSINWLKGIEDSKKEQYNFLLWYPLNKTTISPGLNLRSDDIIKLGYSKVILELTQRKILEFQINQSYKVSDKVYDYFSDQIDILKADSNNIEYLQYIKHYPFQDLIWNCIFSDKL